jgi:2-polyprenyl-3-methyl-5-hydroxy-6-metoxy-1,4-benzoquinol methylase
MKTMNLKGRLATTLLATLAEAAPDPLRKMKARMQVDSGANDPRAYAREQMLSRARHGMGGVPFPDLKGKDVLELGCGHGGIALHMAMLGAKSVTGIDVNDADLEVAKQLRAELAIDMPGLAQRVRFEVMNGNAMNLRDAQFDVVVADNLFEHVDDPANVMRECHRVLRPGGVLVVPTFSSIWSKHGLHLKNGLKVPWANLVFAEETIVAVVKQRARAAPELLRHYPGAAHDVTRVRDLRRHRDLNDITHQAFLDMAKQAQFEIDMFVVYATKSGRVLRKLLPGLISEQGQLLDVLSTGAGALLRKPS